MPLTAESMAVLEELQKQGVPQLDDLPAVEARQYFNAMFKTAPEDQEPVARIEELRIPVAGGEIPARLYAPAGKGPLPVLVHYHGGGWVFLNLDTHDGLCRQLANGVGCAVVAVEYRKAPEHRFPTALEDCYAALQWVAQHAGRLGVDAGRIAVIGDSAGGNLAATVAILARDRKGPALCGQVLTYPAVDATLGHPSIRENADAPILTQRAMTWFYGHYLGGHNPKDPLVSPLLTASLGGLPPAFVSTAEMDPLRDEGEAYAARLAAAGNEVTVKRYLAVFHGYALMGKFIPEARTLVAAQVRFLRACFGL